jgi:hypothetical protein
VFFPALNPGKLEKGGGLGVAFDEDSIRKRNGFTAPNYSILNRIALNLLKNEKTTKTRVKGKRLKAGLDNKYLCKLLKNLIRPEIETLDFSQAKVWKIKGNIYLCAVLCDLWL